MSTESITAPATITVTLDMRQFVAEYYGDSAGDQISRMAAEIVAKDVGTDARRAVAEAIRDQVEQIVTEALTAGFRKVNTWGEPTGEPTTLRESIAAEAQAWFSKPIGDTYSRGPAKTALQKFIADEVDRQIKADLATALADAKRQVLDRVKDQAAAVIADTITRQAAAR